jgi:hypothetical protein
MTNNTDLFLGRTVTKIENSDPSMIDIALGNGETVTVSIIENHEPSPINISVIEERSITVIENNEESTINISVIEERIRNLE